MLASPAVSLEYLCAKSMIICKTEPASRLTQLRVFHCGLSICWRPGTDPPKDFHDPAGGSADLEYIASWLGLDRLGIGVKFANQGASIFLS